MSPISQRYVWTSFKNNELTKKMNPITTFLQKSGIPIPDNNTPDSPVAAKVKQLLAEEFELSPDIVTNEAKLLLNLDLYDLERLDFLVAWMNAFDIDHKLLDEIMRPDGKGTDILFRVRTVGELVALTELLEQRKSLNY